jgi:hypothetical protein
MARSTILLALLCVAASAACSAPVDPAADEAAPIGEDEASLEVGSVYVARRDVRKCASPFCGGYFVHAVNRPLTRCADGAVQPECYAAVADFAALALDPAGEQRFDDDLGAGRALVRATLRPGAGPGLYGLGLLGVREGWRAATRAAPEGTFFAVKSIERTCPAPTAPCPLASQVELNGGPRRLVAAVDLTGVGASPRALAGAQAELRATGLIVAGKDVVVLGPRTWSPRVTLVATQLYTRVPPRVGPLPCAGFLGRACPSWLVCDITIPSACKGADLPGECKARPEACDDVWRPVCGCDGETYANDCFRLMAGAQIDHDGACAPGE